MRHEQSESSLLIDYNLSTEVLSEDIYFIDVVCEIC